jgi:hypothetical protein
MRVGEGDTLRRALATLFEDLSSRRIFATKNFRKKF